MSTKKSILIVDDSSVVRAAVRALLKPHLEFEVLAEAVNGQDAVNMAERLEPDLIILDLSMPVMNGLEAAALLIKMLPEVRIVLFTAHDGPEVERQAKMAGIHAVVSKNHGSPTLVTQAKALTAEQ